MIWNKPRIIQQLRRLHKAGEELSYNALARKRQSLVSAAAYHFGSYRGAMAAAGLPYEQFLRRPRWSKQTIIAQIKKARRAGEELHWSAVSKRKDELGKAAFASLQKRLFGQWHRALHAAGLDADEISQYRAWNRDTVVFEIKARAAEGEALNSGALQHEDAGLHAAAVRYFGSYDKALKAARLDPKRLRLRKQWSHATVIAAIKAVHRSGTHLSDSTIRKQSPALYGAAVRLFGSFTKARTAAGVNFLPRPAKVKNRSPKSEARIKSQSSKSQRTGGKS
jgi:hypothetical protein